jgi:hypothetical protein
MRLPTRRFYEGIKHDVTDVAVRMMTSEMDASMLTAKPLATTTPGYAWLACGSPRSPGATIFRHAVAGLSGWKVDRERLANDFESLLPQFRRRMAELRQIVLSIQQTAAKPVDLLASMLRREADSQAA